MEKQGILERLFHIKELGSNVRTEVIAGVTTFFTMAYVIFVNPAMLSLTGMDYYGVFMATIIASIIGTLIMAFVANVPYALAPGMGLNAFFTFTVCFAMGFTWQQALGLVLLCGIINTIITFTGLRKIIIKAMPKVLQSAIAGGIGMFIAYIGFKSAGLFKFTADSPFLSIVPPTGIADAAAVGNTVVSAGASTTPGLVTFTDPALLLAVFGLVLMVILLVKKVRGAILIGILTTTIVGVVIDLTGVLGGTLLTGIKTVDLSGAAITSSITSIQHTAFQIDFFGLWSNPTKVMLAVTAAIGFCLTDIFDCIGTFIGTGRKSGIFDEHDWKLFERGGNFNSRMDRALIADLTATTVGAFVGTSNTTTYVESASGIAEGGRTGFTSVVVAILFAICIIFTPVASVVPAAATAPALIVVGAMMMAAFAEIAWTELSVAIPAFLAAVMMPLAYSITIGISFGFIAFVIIAIVLKKTKEVHPIIYGVSLLFVLNFIMQAIFQV
jgi:AGZA family xanthine/uracil permease-like MFS transporter